MIDDFVFFTPLQGVGGKRAAKVLNLGGGNKSKGIDYEYLTHEKGWGFSYSLIVRNSLMEITGRKGCKNFLKSFLFSVIK